MDYIIPAGRGGGGVIMLSWQYFLESLAIYLSFPTMDPLETLQMSMIEAPTTRVRKIYVRVRFLVS